MGMQITENEIYFDIPAEHVFSINTEEDSQGKT